MEAKENGPNVKHSGRGRRVLLECFTFGPFSFASILFFQFLGFGLVWLLLFGLAMRLYIRSTRTVKASEDKNHETEGPGSCPGVHGETTWNCP
jgi:hypothetical protein